MRVREVSLVICAMLGPFVSAEEVSTPSMEFLEYLGSMVEEEGELMGPEEIEERMATVDVQITRDEDPDAPQVTQSSHSHYQYCLPAVL